MEDLMPVDNIHPKAIEFDAQRLAGKRTLVVGASSGIGAAAVRRFALEGATVVAAARREEQLSDLCGEVDAAGGKVSYVVCDVRDEDSVADLVSVTVDRLGGLDSAFNAHGVGGTLKPIHEVSVDEFDETVAVNLRGTFLAMKYQIDAMRRNGGGSIVNTSSIAGLVASPQLPDYGATKWGLASLTKSAAIAYAPDNIRVNAIAPGATSTEMLAKLLPTEEILRHVASASPLNFVALPDDMARVALFLLSEEARWITGVVLPVDGGASAD
jgi:NAD(P)-dependent dehydrogenase (short-subunit alcohol dehydrogenase family)